jgi:dolichol-phosphate mannosyltransferase
MARALVTGAGGFVGANLARHLAAEGHDVVALHRPGNPPWRLADGARPDAVRLAPVDLEDAAAVAAAVTGERPDWIFHLAAHGAYSWQRDVGRMLAVNVAATEALLGAAREIGAALAHAGSSSEYGYVDHPPREDERVEPNSHYAVAKVAGTHLCRLAAAQHGQRAVTLRLYSVYGPWEEPGRLMPTLVARALEGRWPPLVDRSIARDYVWIDDVCDAFVRAVSAEGVEAGAIVNVGSGVQTSLGELVDVARDVFAVEAEPQWGTMAARGWDTTTWVADPSRARDEFGWAATTPLAQGLRALGDWIARDPAAADRYAEAGVS